MRGTKLRDHFPSISIIIPAYNARNTIAHCIESLLAQRYLDDSVQIVVVDNNSDDGTPDIVMNYPVELTFEIEKQSSYAARNTGIHHATGEIITFIDADCFPDPNWLIELIKPFQNQQICGVLGKVVSHEPTNLVEKFTHHADPLGYKTLNGLISMITANVAYRHEVLLQVGGFCSDMYTGADVDLGWRIQLLPGCQVCYAPKAIVFHQHRTTIKGLFWQYYRYGDSEIILDTLHKNSPSYSRTPKKQIVRIISQFRALITYLISFLYRIIRSLIFQWDTQYVTWPLLWFVAESGSLLGKIRGIYRTRCFSRKIYYQNS